MSEKVPLLEDPSESILIGCKNNNLSCQEQLYKHCYPAMTKIAVRYAGDMDGAGIIFNNAMLRVFKGLSSYQHEKKFMGWVKTIVVNCCLDFVKSRNKFENKQVELSMNDTSFSSESNFKDVTINEIQQMIQKLPKTTAVVFNLFI